MLRTYTMQCINFSNHFMRINCKYKKISEMQSQGYIGTGKSSAAIRHKITGICIPSYHWGPNKGKECKAPTNNSQCQYHHKIIQMQKGRRGPTFINSKKPVGSNICYFLNSQFSPWVGRHFRYFRLSHSKKIPFLACIQILFCMVLFIIRVSTLNRRKYSSFIISRNFHTSWP